jgi:hypothetical protein
MSVEQQSAIIGYWLRSNVCAHRPDTFKLASPSIRTAWNCLRRSVRWHYNRTKFHRVAVEDQKAATVQHFNFCCFFAGKCMFDTFLNLNAEKNYFHQVSTVLHEAGRVKKYRAESRISLYNFVYSCSRRWWTFGWCISGGMENGVAYSSYLKNNNILCKVIKPTYGRRSLLNIGGEEQGSADNSIALYCFVKRWWRQILPSKITKQKAKN